MPPVPNRSERDRLASMSTGFAPGLASESFPLPRRATTETGPVYRAEPSGPRAVPDARSGTVPLPRDESISAASVSAASGAPDAREWPAAVTTPAPKADSWDATPVEALAGQNSAPAARANAASGPIPQAVAIDRSSSAVAWPPPTRTTAIFEPFKPPDITAVPNVPDAGLWQSMKYTIDFARARWQRRGAIRELQEQIRRDTGVLDGILGTLGKQARFLAVEGKTLDPENHAIDEAERRRKTAEHECSEIGNRQAEEVSKFADSESERLSKLGEAEAALEAAQSEHGALEAQRRSLRDKRKAIESRQKGYLKAAEGREAEASKEPLGTRREELRGGAESLRRDAAGLDQERQDVERRIETLERPMEQISSRIDALKSDVDAAKRALNDLREGNRHRLAELEAEQGRKSRELAQAEAEIQRRLVTLGTVVNLNRIDREEFRDLYEQIDTLRATIGARSNEIDKLSAEREAYDKASLIRGACVLGGAFLVFLSLLAIILAIS